jgi:NADH-quinone oxidoreductase subunit L
MHHEQDMRKMGGLWKYIPITYAVMVIGNLAITGFGIPGLDLGFAGFYSKDTIIEAAWAAGQESPVGMFAFVIGILAAGLTAFYSWRLAFMTFHGTPKWAGHGHHAHDDHGAHDDHATAAQIETHSEPLPDHHDDHGHGHELKPHEAPWSMRAPLLLLALGAIGAGYVFVEKFVGEERNEFWRGAIFNAPANHILEHAHHAPTLVLWAPLIVSMAGLLLAWWVYVRNEGMGQRIADEKGPLWTFFYNKWFFDELYDVIFVRGAKFIGDVFWKVGDQKLIDGFGPDGVSKASYVVGQGAARLQSGYVYHYAFVMLLGVAALLSFALWAWA